MLLDTIQVPLQLALYVTQQLETALHVDLMELEVLLVQHVLLNIIQLMVLHAQTVLLSMLTVIYATMLVNVHNAYLDIMSTRQLISATSSLHALFPTVWLALILIALSVTLATLISLSHKILFLALLLHPALYLAKFSMAKLVYAQLAFMIMDQVALPAALIVFLVLPDHFVNHVLLASLLIQVVAQFVVKIVSHVLQHQCVLLA